ncbi:MAG: ABC transporter substrate-binding protein [Chloroflexaceae bacterium]|nr:ABC transporter substrate-binding protein [Chloroflexaceae bacterium]
MWPGRIALFLLLTLLLVACGAVPNQPTPTPPIDPDAQAAQPVELLANLNRSCATEYSPDIDYFPEKVSVQYADGWTIEYFNNYKVITVLTPWRGAEETFQYVLVQCGTPAPSGYGDAPMIEVPVNSMISMSTTYLPHFEALEVLDRLTGVDNADFIYSPAVLDALATANVPTVGSGPDLDLERVLDIEPNVVMTFAIGSPDTDTHPQLTAAGVPVVINADYMETSPLGRAEWVKFTAALFNRERSAENLFERVAEEYNDLAALADTAEQRPTVFTEAPFQGIWYLPGGESYAATLLADAGAAYLWAEDASTGSLALDFEVVYEQALTADYWLNPGIWTSREEMLEADERFGDFAAFQNGNVYNATSRTTPAGGNDYREGGVLNPQLILADLISIFHPDLLPDHELFYFERVQ